MIFTLLTVFDKATGAFLPPFSVAHVNVGLRAFADQVNNQQSDIGRHPEDFTLFRIGTFDDATSKIELLNAPESIANAIQYAKPKEA